MSLSLCLWQILFLSTLSLKTLCPPWPHHHEAEETLKHEVAVKEAIQARKKQTMRTEEQEAEAAV